MFMVSYPCETCIFVFPHGQVLELEELHVRTFSGNEQSRASQPTVCHQFSVLVRSQKLEEFDVSAVARAKTTKSDKRTQTHRLQPNLNIPAC